MTFPLNTVYFGDCRDTMRKMIAAGVRVNCIVTSPPYWGLRDYGHTGQLGLEKTPNEYVANMVEVFRLARDLLADDGTLWLNLGDTYASAGGAGWQGEHGQRANRRFTATRDSVAMRDIFRRPPVGVKSKDLIGIPWRVAFALQADGWYLRQDIIWNKPNPMPESVRDRCTKAHEYIFLLTKNPRYFFDSAAIAEPADSAGQTMKMPDGMATYKGGHTSIHRDGREKGKNNGAIQPSTRNKRSVWTVTTKPFSGAHFATFPPDLIEPCILAGTSAYGHCPKCGAGWTRVVEDGEADLEHQRACGGDRNGEYHGQATKDYAAGGAQEASATKARILAGMREKITTGWRATCECGADPVPAVVFDPFMGSGTTAQVAQSLGLDWIGAELNPDYEPLQRERARQIGMAL